MTNIDIIAMAREAGAIHIHKNPKEFAVVGNRAIERFAELVASLVRAEERKACAKECKFGRSSADIEQAIRARGEASKRSNT